MAAGAPLVSVRLTGGMGEEEGNWILDLLKGEKKAPDDWTKTKKNYSHL